MLRERSLLENGEVRELDELGVNNHVMPLALCQEYLAEAGKQSAAAP